ncbi:MAG: hypothetical protein GY946_15415 [bacterium]|nr:hypothetical protein [bacterium]
MPVSRFLLVLLLAFPLGGCFVLDELDWGMKELDKHPVNPNGAPPRAAKQDSKPSAPAAPESESSWEEKLPDMREWWNEARTLGSTQKDESIARCRLDGRDQFMRIDECQARGGKVGS